MRGRVETEPVRLAAGIKYDRRVGLLQSTEETRELIRERGKQSLVMLYLFEV